MQNIIASTRHKQKKNSQATQPAARLHRSNSGEDPRKPRGARGRRTRRQERTRTNTPARQPKPKPNSAIATQVKDPKSHGEKAGNGPGGERE